MAWLGDFIDWYHDNGLLPGLWKGATGQQSQEKMAEDNLDYQRERNEIEDARYAEETEYNRAFAEGERDYNRAFAEDERDYNRAFAEEERAYNRDWALNERDYNRALQQQIFEREDTAISRQAEELSRLGINPLSQNMNGLGAGSVVSSSPSGSSSAPVSASAPSASAPSASGRGGSALQKNMQIVDSMLPLVSTIGNIVEATNQAATGQLNRDALQLENDRKFIENHILARKNGFTYYDAKRGSKKARYHYNISDNNGMFPDSSGVELYKDYETIRDIKHKVGSGIYASDTDLMKTLKDFSSENYVDMAEKVVTNLTQIFDKLNFFKPNL